MTTAAARRQVPVRAGGGVKSRPKLVVVAPQRVVGRTPFVLLVGGLLLAGLLSLLMLHTLAAQDAFHQTSLQQRLANLTDTQQRLEQQVQIDSAPAALRQRAKALGMVPSVVIGYHQRPNGRIIAHEVAANSPAATAAVTQPTSVTTTTKQTNATSTKAQSTNANSTNANSTKAQSTKAQSTNASSSPTTSANAAASSSATASQSSQSSKHGSAHHHHRKAAQQ